MILPPERTSIVETILATMAGGRKGMGVTTVPNFIPVVTADN
jgi:hypothetical protein